MHKNLTAADYDDAYFLPDHWIMHEHDPHGMNTTLHGYYVNRVIEIIKNSGAKTVLEVGCGDGWACGQMVKAGLEATGIDWSKRAIDYAKICVPDAKFLVGDAREAHFPERFDAVALIEVIEHIAPDHCVTALRNISRHLKNGAIFVLTTPSTNFKNANTQHYRHFTEAVLRDMISQVGGLSVVAIEGYGDAIAEIAHWRKARWFNNRFYQIKHIHSMLLSKLNEAGTAGPTPLDRCHGLIVTMRQQ
jgi:SAM-dependent methyltransferase